MGLKIRYLFIIIASFIVLSTSYLGVSFYATQNITSAMVYQSLALASVTTSLFFLIYLQFKPNFYHYIFAMSKQNSKSTFTRVIYPLRIKVLGSISALILLTKLGYDISYILDPGFTESMMSLASFSNWIVGLVLGILFLICPLLIYDDADRFDVLGCNIGVLIISGLFLYFIFFEHVLFLSAIVIGPVFFLSLYNAFSNKQVLSNKDYSVDQRFKTVNALLDANCTFLLKSARISVILTLVIAFAITPFLLFLMDYRWWVILLLTIATFFLTYASFTLLDRVNGLVVSQNTIRFYKKNITNQHLYREVYPLIKKFDVSVYQVSQDQFKKLLIEYNTALQVWLHHPDTVKKEVNRNLKAKHILPPTPISKTQLPAKTKKQKTVKTTVFKKTNHPKESTAMGETNNYKFKDLKVYGSTEWLADGKKKYRRVFEQRETSYLYLELSMYNKRYDINDWEANLQLVCYQLVGANMTEVTTQNVKLQASMQDHILYIREGWGHKSAGGFWKAGTYLWEAYFIEDSSNKKKLGEITFYVEDATYANDTYKPYFSVESAALYEGSSIGVDVKERVYMTEFNCEDTRYVWVNFAFRNTLGKNWQGEFFFNFYTSSGSLKGSNAELKHVKQSDELISITTGWGSDNKGIWFQDRYYLEIVFMDKVVAVVPFKCGSQFLEGKNQLYLEHKIDRMIHQKSVESSTTPALPKTQPIVPQKENFVHKVHQVQIIRSIYQKEISQTADELKLGLSILIRCDKIMTKYLWEAIIDQVNGGYELLEIIDLEQGSSSLLLDQIQMFRKFAKSNKSDVILVIPHFDLLTGGSHYLSDGAREFAQLLYRNVNRPILAFTDISFDIPEVLSSRFSMQKTLTGVPRATVFEGKLKPTANILLSQEEIDHFAEFDSEELYRVISGMNPLKIRQAITYAINERVSQQLLTMEQLKDAIQVFKSKTSNNFSVPNVQFEDIGGYREVKAKLEESIHLIQGHALNIHDELRQELIPRGFIFYGPPGTGKTLFAKAVANKLNANVMVVSGPEVVNMYVGESERKIRETFAEARRNAPSVLVFDEFDSIATKRSSQSDGGTRVGNSMVAQILTEMDGFRPDVPVLVIGTTNRLDIIDEALLRPSRFQPIAIDLPDLEARKAITNIYAKKFEVSISSEIVSSIGESTVGFNGDEIKSIFREFAINTKLHNDIEDSTKKLGNIVGKIRARKENQNVSSEALSRESRSMFILS
ncbi:MAG: ATP-binding protein [Flammeovirgaceae bacterium]